MNSALPVSATKAAQKIYQPHLSTARDARAVRTREALRRALLQLLEVEAFEHITIRHITTEAGIGYTTFFRHHPTKESLLDDLAAVQIRRLIDLTMPQMEITNTRAASEALFAYVDGQRRLWSTLLTGGAAGALRAEFLRISREIAATMPRPGIWPPAEVAIRLVVSGTIELLAWWLRQSDPISIKEVAEIHDCVVVQPAINNPDIKGAVRSKAEVARNKAAGRRKPAAPGRKAQARGRGKTAAATSK
ncbi:MAG: TetR/AcrR family transcriptional regulator [Nevskia sp.]|nr:TetR/AcrR family transcriptional regulator [Nevskia sp.]